MVASLVVQRLKHLPAVWETWVRSLGQEDPLEKEMATTPVLLPGKFHGWRSLVGYSPWGHEESDTTEQFHFHLNGDIGSVHINCPLPPFSALRARCLYCSLGSFFLSPHRLFPAAWCLGPSGNSFFPFSVILCHSFLLCPA